ncbi:MAG TPA: DUF4349 domain-containing protein [Oscillospiraceae bacterium]|nr:DUF4349 domain-containing protein [Oscillospiraceae bacterium]HRW56593.1 DUF4349 domain-containing protein [Oscillospiraceae bacterium]
MKKVFAILVSLLLILSFAACASSAKDEATMEEEAPQASEDYDGQMLGGGYSGMTASESGWNYTADASKDTAETPAVNDSAAAETTGRKLIRTVTMELQTLEFDTFTEQVDAMVTDLGGYVQSSSFNGNSIYSSSDRNVGYTLRIPADKLDAFLEQIGGMANVTYRNEETQDVTLDYVDIEAHKESLQTEYDRLIELLAMAENVDAIVTLEARLSEVRYQIESYESQLRMYDNQVDYSTVYLTIDEVQRETQVEEGTVWERISTRLSDNFYQIGQDFENFSVWFVSSLPYIVIWAVIIAVLALAVSGILRGSRKRRENREAKKAAKLRAKYEAKQAAPESPVGPSEEKKE